MDKSTLLEIVEEFLFYYDTNRSLTNKDGALKLVEQLMQRNLVKLDKVKSTKEVQKESEI